MIFRCSDADWLIQYFEKVWNFTKDLYHIWFENYAMVELWTHEPEVRAHMESTKKHWHFNAYLGGRRGERLWKPDDFLVHFAGVYDTKKMLGLVADIQAAKVPRIKVFPEAEDAAANE
jgi:hypothetical protein